MKMNKTILEMINKKEKNKDLYKPLIISLSEQLETYFVEKNYDLINEKLSTYFEVKNINECKENKYSDISNRLKYIYIALVEFLEKYPFGNILNLELNKFGQVEVIINCIVWKSNFKDEFKLLEDKGFSLENKDSYNGGILLNDNNTKLIKNLLISIGGNKISYISRCNKKGIDIISEIRFLLNPDEFNLILKKEEYEEILNENLSDKEFNLLKQYISEINSAISYLNDSDLLDDKNICCEVICGYIYNICEMLNIETNISKIYEEKISKTRKAVRNLNELTSYKDTKIKEDYKELLSKLNDLLNTNLSFFIKEASFSHYGICNVKCYFADEGLTEEDTINREDLKKKFSCFTDKDGEIYISADSRNIELLEEELKSYFNLNNLEILEVNVKKKEQMMINSFVMKFTTFK